MTVNSKQKGKRYELEVANAMREYGYDAKRSVQYNGQEGLADVIGVPGLWIECKHNEHLNIDDALNQAIRDHDETSIPIVVHRKNNTRSKVTLRLEDFMEIWTALDHWMRSK